MPFNTGLKDAPLSKNYFCPRTTDLAEILRGHVSRPRQYTVKIWAQNIEVFKSYPKIKGKKVGVRASLISPLDLMIQISGWCQNVANTCHYNLTEPDF